MIIAQKIFGLVLFAMSMFYMVRFSYNERKKLK